MITPSEIMSIPMSLFLVTDSLRNTKDKTGMQMYVSDVSAKNTFKSSPFIAKIDKNATIANIRYAMIEKGCKYILTLESTEITEPFFKRRCATLVKMMITSVSI